MWIQLNHAECCSTFSIQLQYGSKGMDITAEVVNRTLGRGGFCMHEFQAVLLSIDINSKQDVYLQSILLWQYLKTLGTLCVQHTSESRVLIAYNKPMHCKTCNLWWQWYISGLWTSYPTCHWWTPMNQCRGFRSKCTNCMKKWKNGKTHSNSTYNLEI
jgi:hypothetical protein